MLAKSTKICNTPAKTQKSRMLKCESSRILAKKQKEAKCKLKTNRSRMLAEDEKKQNAS